MLNNLVVEKLLPSADLRENVILLSELNRTVLPNNPLIGFEYTNDRSKENIFYPILFDSKISKDKVGVSNIIRKQFGLMLGQDIKIKIIQNPEPNFKHLSFEIYKLQKFDSKKIDQDYLIDFLCSKKNSGFPFFEGQFLYIPYSAISDKSGPNNPVIIVKVLKTVIEEKMESIKKITESDCNFELSLNAALTKSYKLYSKLHRADELSIDFKRLGFGGYSKVIQEILQNFIFPRFFSKELTEKYDFKPEKGVLFYGPPGTGKTLLMKLLKNYLCDKSFDVTLKIINGPELINKYVGQSEENLRNIFMEAIDDSQKNGLESSLHLFLFDEIEVMFPKRVENAGGVNVHNSMVNQFLTLLDGTESLENIFVVGSTNRPELIDEAVLRSGRLGMKLLINLPDQEERQEILDIYVSRIRKAGLLQTDVTESYLETLAANTENFSGADLASMISNAKAQAIAKNIIESEGSEGNVTIKPEPWDEKNIDEIVKISKTYIDKAYENIKSKKEDKSLKVVNSFVKHELLNPIIKAFEDYLRLIKKSISIKDFNFFITGETGVGKTELAKKLAQSARDRGIESHLINSTNFNSLNTISKKMAQADFSLVILDGLERLLRLIPGTEYRYDYSKRSELESFLKDTPGKHLVLVIAESNNFVKETTLFDLSNAEIFRLHKFKYLQHDLIVGLSEPYSDFNAQDKNFSSQSKELKKPLSIRNLILKIEKYREKSNQEDTDLNFKDFLNSFEYKEEAPLGNVTQNSSSLFNTVESKTESMTTNETTTVTYRDKY